MKTAEALTRFLKKCEERGLAPETRRTYHGYLRHFAEEYPDLPTDTKTIEQFLKKRKETPARRGSWYKKLQAFYAYLEQFEEVPSPIPAKGKVGRPRKNNPITNLSSLPENKLVTGGYSLSSYTSISTVEAVNAFFTSRKVEGVSKRTLENYGYFFKPFLHKFPTLPTTAEEIDEFLGSIKGTPETRWTYRRVLVALYHFLEERKQIPKDLFTFPKIKVPRKVRRVLSEEELRQLFTIAGTFQEKAILHLLIDSKIRASELTSLTRENTYPDHIIVDAKGGGQRQVPVNTATYDMLLQLSPSGLLFRVNGNPMSREYLSRLLRRLMEESGLEGKKLGSHILRHSASVQHMRHGGDLKSLQGELGHATTRMTDIYAELADSDVKEAHDRVDVLGKIAGPSFVERAKCYACQHEIVLELAKVKETKCPKCHQLGRWYLPDHQGQGVLG